MKNKPNTGILLLTALWLSSCEGGEEAPRALTITDITPGTTRLGANTLNTAVIGDTLTISGQGFSTVAAEDQVSVQGIPARVVTAYAAALKAVVPAGVPFTYVDVMVARKGYQPAVHRISVRSVPSPIITSIRPTQGRIGTVVTIYGKHLLETVEANHLTFADASGQADAVVVRPINPLLATADSIRIVVPTGAGTGKIALYARPAQNVGNGYFSIVTPVFTVLP